MNNRKNNSSVIIIATLGVYLGLVLVGATPQVMAQAAMTRQFNVKDEIEVKDNLDKKPDTERTPASDAVQGYLQDIEYFLVNLQRLRNKGSFDASRDVFDVAQSTMLPCLDGNRAGRFTPTKWISPNPSSQPALVQFSRSMVFGYSLGDCIASSEFSGAEVVDSRYNFKLDETSFSVNISVKKQSPQSALDLKGMLERTREVYNAAGNNKVRQAVIDNTYFETENNQVFIVTRLPRAGLDSLLALEAR